MAVLPGLPAFRSFAKRRKSAFGWANLEWSIGKLRAALGGGSCVKSKPSGICPARAAFSACFLISASKSGTGSSGGGNSQVSMASGREIQLGGMPMCEPFKSRPVLLASMTCVAVRSASEISSTNWDVSEKPKFPGCRLTRWVRRGITAEWSSGATPYMGLMRRWTPTSMEMVGTRRNPAVVLTLAPMTEPDTGSSSISMSPFRKYEISMLARPKNSSWSSGSMPAPIMAIIVSSRSKILNISRFSSKSFGQAK
mmetsp:Transcript_105154/g.250353  ORF Transcript_105154/g.250353 Transcript_105154/m.250353 type:complete len:254 (-) Transcript_105154:307-1068(-)